ncbi:hypothetical protein [Salinisphaera shabanensis]|uniref:hypothetical protein n=1 Tax=Salinisphaera shabanensis TaxID=180542 RepID=UPI00333EABA2
MKSALLGISLLLALGTTQALADTQCRKSAEGDVSCQRVDEDSALDSETTDQPVEHPTEEARDENAGDDEAKPQGGDVGDKSTQSGDPGITY